MINVHETLYEPRTGSYYVHFSFNDAMSDKEPDHIQAIVGSLYFRCYDDDELAGSNLEKAEYIVRNEVAKASQARLIEIKNTKRFELLARYSDAPPIAP